MYPIQDTEGFTGHRSTSASAEFAMDAIKPAGPDIVVEPHGSIALLKGSSKLGRDWLESNLHEPQRWGSSFVAEVRYVHDVVYGAINDGLSVALVD
jgi:hypothetical protein